MPILGAEELDRKLDEIARKGIISSTRRAIRAGAKILQGAMRKRANKRTGKLSMGVKIKNSRSETGVAMSVGVSQREVLYGPWVIKGHRIGKRPAKRIKKRHGDHRRQVMGNDFVTAAFDEVQSQVATKILQVAKQEIESQGTK